MTAPLPIAAPELRALLMLDAPPAGCFAHPVTRDDLAPHLRPGEFAIIDPADRDPVHGELFLVAWARSDARPDEPEDTALVQAYRRQHQGVGGEPFTAWWVGSLCNRYSPETRDRLIKAQQWGAFGWSNGPYCDGVLEEQIRGRVIGILAPRFEEPKRLPAIGGRTS